MTKTPTTDTTPETPADLTPPALDLTALMKIAERATPGPWTIEPPHAGFSAIYGLNGELIFGLAAGGEDERLPVSDIEANAAFLDAFSPSSALAILTRLVAAEARAEKEEAERDDMVMLMLGGEDVPGLVRSLSFTEVRKSFQGQQAALTKAEARVAVLEGALEKARAHLTGYEYLHPQVRQAARAARQALEKIQ